MARRLPQYAYQGKNAANSSGDNDPKMTSKQAEMSEERTKLLASLKTDITTLLRSELKSTHTSEFEDIKSEIKAVKTEVVCGIDLLHADLESMKRTVTEMEEGLNVCADKITGLQKSVCKMESEIANLQEKCLDMEERMSRCNIRIINVAETPGSCTPASVSTLLKEVLRMESEILIDRSHRGSQSKQPCGKPPVIVAKLHCYQDCVEVLRPGQGNWSSRISIFPVFPSGVPRARGAFNEVKKLLQGDKRS